MTHVPSSPEFWSAQAEEGKSTPTPSRLVSTASAVGFVLVLFAVVIVGLQITRPWMLIGYIAAIGLIAIKHSQRHAGFKPKRFHRADHRNDRLHVARLRVPPGSSHAVARCAIVRGLARFGDDLLDFHQF